MDTINLRSTRLACTDSWRKTSFVFWRTVWLLLAVVLVTAFVPRGIAQSSKATSEDLFFSLGGAHHMGDAKARVAIVEFGDYQCPWCGQHATQTLPQIVASYIKPGKIQYFFKDFPVEAIHPQAFKAAEAARCAGEQHKYWEMHDRLFKNQQLLSVNALPAHATALGLDVPKFQQCLDSGTYADQIRKDAQEARKNNVPGTPQFYLGTLDDQGSRMRVVTMLGGAYPYSAFQEALDQILSSAEGRKDNPR